eukprot:1189554-Prorocentrum_minimum.AAC.1
MFIIIKHEFVTCFPLLSPSALPPSSAAAASPSASDWLTAANGRLPLGPADWLAPLSRDILIGTRT